MAWYVQLQAKTGSLAIGKENLDGQTDVLRAGMTVEIDKKKAEVLTRLYPQTVRCFEASTPPNTVETTIDPALAAALARAESVENRADEILEAAREEAKRLIQEAIDKLEAPSVRDRVKAAAK